MPQDLCANLHRWIKQQEKAEALPADPDERDLLGFPSVVAEHPKYYLRRLWLPANNDRVAHPRFFDTDIIEMVKLAWKVINSFAHDDAKLYQALQDGDFLEAEADRILVYEGYGRRVWGDDCGASTRLKSKAGGGRPQWGTASASGKHQEGDDDSALIKLSFRQWMAAQLQIKVNAPCREQKRSADASTRQHVIDDPTTLAAPTDTSTELAKASLFRSNIGSRSNSGHCDSGIDVTDDKPTISLRVSHRNQSSKWTTSSTGEAAPRSKANSCSRSGQSKTVAYSRLSKGANSFDRAGHMTTRRAKPKSRRSAYSAQSETTLSRSTVLASRTSRRSERTRQCHRAYHTFCKHD